MLLLWKLRDFSVIFSGAILMVILSSAIHSVFPLAPFALYAILTITFPDGSICDYIVKLGRFVVTQQQVYFWQAGDSR